MKKHITAFYLETLLLIVVFIGIILVLTEILGATKLQSSRARLLTNSVCLAENAAEAVSVSESPEELAGILNVKNNAAYESESQVVWAYYDSDMTPAHGDLAVKITWEPEGALVSSRITVFQWPSEQEIYSLRTAVYLGEVSP